MRWPKLPQSGHGKHMPEWIADKRRRYMRYHAWLRQEIDLTMDRDDEYMDADDVSIMLDVGKDTVRYWMLNGLCPLTDGGPMVVLESEMVRVGGAGQTRRLTTPTKLLDFVFRLAHS